MPVCKRSYRKIRTGLAFERHRGTMGRKGEPNSAKLSRRELEGKRKNPVLSASRSKRSSSVNTVGGCPGLREEASEKQCVLLGCSRYNLFTVDAKSIDCESGCKTQTHRRGSVLQVNQELSSELRFVSLGFPLRFPVPMFY